MKKQIFTAIFLLGFISAFLFSPTYADTYVFQEGDWWKLQVIPWSTATETFTYTVTSTAGEGTIEESVGGTVLDTYTFDSYPNSNSQEDFAVYSTKPDDTLTIGNYQRACKKVTGTFSSGEVAISWYDSASYIMLKMEIDGKINSIVVELCDRLGTLQPTTTTPIPGFGAVFLIYIISAVALYLLFSREKIIKHKY